MKQRFSISQIVLLVLLLLVILLGALPGYLSGKWSWADLPKINNVRQLINLRKTGLTLPGWKTLGHTEVQIGGNKWSVQVIEQQGITPITLFLMPQNYYKKHPQVDWVDLEGVEKWKTDEQQVLKFPAGEENQAQVTAHFFRAWNQQTFAVVQWYAWFGGGHFAISQWFWNDQLAQLHQRRVPWVAVCLKIPIEPFSELKTVESLAKTLGETVQSTLNQQVFSKLR
jgi:cyanoexosortase B-associated protein